ncbi:uncharacterized protein LOC120842302 isoform X2 [Ixodes scapularis]|uniref:uncharacterized protein LOC120842302 isoform X2 n=1 Tax=Ixodes scapularis TaxID=6945 RepID=UPI001AD67584|nr:uncharacterized protein LOC120842302 isoform X2 [Ixodes scapularis]
MAGATDGGSASRLARVAGKGSSLSSQLHPPAHRGFTAASLRAHDSPSGCRSTYSFTSLNAGPGRSSNTGEPLRRTGSGDIIIGEVLLMKPCRRMVASGDLLSDMVQVELESKADITDFHGARSQAEEETPASCVKRGKAFGKMAGLIVLVVGWLVLVAGFSTYYFLSSKMSVLSTDRTLNLSTVLSVDSPAGLHHQY